MWAKAISAQGTVKATAGSVNIPVVCAGALVHPGDVIVADNDGVVVVPRETRRRKSRGLARSGMPKKNNRGSGCRRGELGLDIYGLRARLKELGVEYIDEEI